MLMQTFIAETYVAAREHWKQNRTRAAAGEVFDNVRNYMVEHSLTLTDSLFQPDMLGPNEAQKVCGVRYSS